MMQTHKDWRKKLSFALWSYRTPIYSSTGVILYSLVYGMDVALPIILEIPFISIIAKILISKEDRTRGGYD